jgi:two-component system, NarL family, nitrate/nitrite response regulator NarL
MTRVLIVTTVRLLSDLIQVACKNQPDLTVVGCVDTKAQALTYQNRCDVILVSHDVEDALTLVQTFGRSTNSPAMVVMGLPNVEPLILRYLEAGAAGCIREQDSSEQLVQAIRLASARQIALTADLFPIVLKRVSALANRERESNPTTPSTNEKNLTHREREILHLIAQGYGNREIAQELTIELGTAKNHVHNILDKLNVKTRRDAAVYYSLGLV